MKSLSVPLGIILLRDGTLLLSASGQKKKEEIVLVFDDHRGFLSFLPRDDEDDDPFQESFVVVGHPIEKPTLANKIRLESSRKNDRILKSNFVLFSLICFLKFSPLSLDCKPSI